MAESYQQPDQEVGDVTRADVDVDEPGIFIAGGDVPGILRVTFIIEGSVDRKIVPTSKKNRRVRRTKIIFGKSCQKTDAGRPQRGIHSEYTTILDIHDDHLAAAVGGKCLDVGDRLRRRLPRIRSRTW